MKFFRIALCIGLFAAQIESAFAGTSTITVLDSASATKIFDVVTDGSGNFVGMQAVCDGTAAAQCAAVKAASTAPATTDTALVVGVSPNSGQSAGSTTSGQNGSMIMGAVTTSAPSYTTAQTNYASLTTAGALRADLASVAGTTVVNGGVAGSQSIGGTVATNVAITANPLNLGAQAVSSENTAVTTARQVQLVADLVGKLITLPYSNPENFVSGATAAMTGTTTTSLIAAPAAGLRNYVTHLICTNSHATVGTFVLVQDGSGGTTIYEGYAAAVGGGFSITFPAPLRQPTTATALFVQDVTTGANVICSGSGYKGA